MATVFRGVHREQDVPVAVKVLDPGVAKSSSLRDEVRAMAGLDHPSIVMVLDRGEVPDEVDTGQLPAGSPYLVMEWASGGTIARWPRPLDWKTLRELLVSLLSALAHAHARGVIHRDLKPSNVLVCTDADPRPGIKLADFGIAAHREQDRSGLGDIAGTASYMAPEQIVGDYRDEGPWTDLYALGCLVHTLATGRPPYEGARASDVLRAHLFEPVPALRPGRPMPERLSDWTAALLHKEPSHRWASAAEALHELRALESGPRAVASARPPTSVQTTPVRGAGRLLGAGLGIFGLRPVPLVDREEERRSLSRVLREVEQEREPRLVILSGGAGVGKSRLCEWLCQEAHEHAGIERLRVLDSPAGGPNEGLGPAVARHLRIDNLGREEAVERVGRWARAVGASGRVDLDALADLAGSGRESARTARFKKPRERHAVIASYLGAAARRRPIVVWLEDAHWGADSLAFVQHLLDRDAAAGLAVLVLATVRDEDAVDRAAERELLSELRARRETVSLHVDPLPPTHWDALVREVAALEGEVAQRIVTRIAGNPQFAVQLIGDWVQRRLLEPDEKGFRLREGADLELPADVLEVWRARIERLLFDRAESDGLALELASVLSPVVVDGSEWREVCSEAGVTPSPGLVDALLDHRFARVHPEGADVAWSYAHAMLRESLEQRARESARFVSHHRLCAEVLRRRPPRRETPERLARHLLAAGDHEAAAAPMLEAARAHFEAGDTRIACADLRERDRLLDTMGAAASDPRRVIGRLLWARSEIGRGHLDDGERLLDSVEPVARSTGDARTLADLLLSRSRLMQRRGRLDDAEGACVEALSVLAGAGADELYASILSWLGVVQFERGSVEEALATQERAHAMLKTLAHRSAAQTLYEIGVIHARRQEWERAEATLARARDEHERYGDRDAVANAVVMLGEIHRRQGRYSEAEARYEEALALYEKTGSGNDAIALLNLGLARLGRGRFREAREPLSSGARLLARRGWDGMLACAQVELATCDAELGDYASFDERLDAAEALLGRVAVADPDLAWVGARAAELLEDAGERERAARVRAIAAEQLMVLGREDEARALVAAVAAGR